MKSKIFMNYANVFLTTLLIITSISTTFMDIKAENQQPSDLDRYNDANPIYFYSLDYGYPVSQSIPPHRQTVTQFSIPLSSNGAVSGNYITLTITPAVPDQNGPFYRTKTIHIDFNIPVYPSSRIVDFNFDPLDIIPGQDYYFTLESNDAGNPYDWGWQYNSGIFLDGVFKVKDVNTWVDLSPWDGLFYEYGRDRLYDPTLDAPSNIELSGHQGGGTHDTFDIGNVGEVASHLTWEIQSAPEWLDYITPTWGEISQGQTATIGLGINNIQESQGDYPGTIHIISNGGNQDIHIILHVPLLVQISTESLTALPNEFLQFSGVQSSGESPLNWNWDFGDISKAYTQNATHKYSAPGTYPVTLNLTDNKGNSTTDNVIINIKNLISDFSCSTTDSKPNRTIFFNDTSRGCNSIENWSWNFDDGKTSYQQNISHQYTSNGNYNVSLTITDNKSNSDHLNQIIHIESNPPVINSILYPEYNGYKSNITFTANITDNISGIQDVKINITFPNQMTENYSLNKSITNMYEYEFHNTSQIGQYNFTVWANDNANNMLKSSKYNFTVSHCFGNAEIGAYNHSVKNLISGSKYMVKESGVATNIIAYVKMNDTNPSPEYRCMIYRYNDSKIIGISEEKNLSELNGKIPDAGWVTFNFTNSSPILIEDVQYILACIGGNSNSLIYYDNNFDFPSGCYYEKNYTNLTEEANFPHIPEYKMHSLLCNYNLDITPPKITNISCNPTVAGFGSNITISADITDNLSGINYVKLNITYPDKTYLNSTMNNSIGDLFSHQFTDTWLAGQYNYTIWSVDNLNNSNQCMERYFNVSASATISISTLKDQYDPNQYINITDPPNPPENLTVVGRGLTWNTYYNTSSGCNILESYQGPVNYQQDNGSWTPINNSLLQLASTHPAFNYGYRVGNDRGLFGAYFKPNLQSDWPIAFTYNRSDNPTTFVVRTKLVGVGYVDPKSNWSYHYLQNVQNSQGQFTSDTATYNGVFTGTDVSWRYDNTGLKEAITLNNATRTVLQNHPPSLYGLNDTTSYLVFITKLDHKNLNIYNASGMLTGNVTISDSGVDFKDGLGVFKCGLPLGDAYELGNGSARHKLTYRIIHLNGDTYLLSGLKVSDVNAMMFPVVIDPTFTVYSTASDGYIYNSNTDYTKAQTATTGTVDYSGQFITMGQKKTTSPTAYYVYRGFMFFDTSTLPSNAYLDSATLSLYKKDDYSTTDFSITIQNGQPAYPHIPLQSGDYNKIHYSGNGGTYNTSGFHSGYNNMSLTQLGWINRTGTTKLCLRSSRDINANAPTGNEYVNVYASEKGSGYQPKLVVVYRNQSKIKNTGSLAFKGYLLIQVQYYNSSQGKWIVEKDTINETSPRTISGYTQLAIDAIFNGHVRTNELHHNSSTYRVYVVFRDSYQNILKTNDGKQLMAWWQFTTNAGT